MKAFHPPELTCIAHRMGPTNDCAPTHCQDYLLICGMSTYFPVLSCPHLRVTLVHSTYVPKAKELTYQ